ncbi:hypothetical protein D3C83_07010 [compost metagenome]
MQATGEALKHVTAAAPRRKDDAQGGPAVFDKLSQSASLVTYNLRRKPRLGTALAVVAILAVAVLLRLGRQPAAEPVATPSPSKKVAAAPAPAPAKAAPKASLPDKPVVPSPQAAAPPAPGTVGFTILPWGEVYINGKRYGVSPPLREVELQPGQHKIEVRNTDFQPFAEVVDVKPGGRIRIRHRFQ